MVEQGSDQGTEQSSVFTNRHILIASIIAGVLVIAAGILFFVRNGGELTAIAQLDASIAAYDGTYDNATFDATSDRLVVDGLTLHDYAVDSEAEPLDLIEIGHFEATGLVSGNLRNVFSNNDEQSLLSELRASDLVFTEAGQSIRVDGLVLTDLATVAIEEGDEENAPLTRSQEIGRSLLSLRASHMEVTGFSSPEQGITGIRIGRAIAEGVASGRVASLVIDEFALWDRGQMGTVGDTLDLGGAHFEVNGVDARVPLQKMLAGEVLTFERQSDFPLFSTLNLVDVIVDDEGSDAMTVSAVTIHNSDYIGSMPTTTTFAIEGFEVPLSSEFLEAEQVQAIAALGYDDLILNLAYRSDFDPTTGDFEITGLTLSIVDIMELSLRLSLTDIPFTEQMADMTANALIESGYVTQVLEQARLQRGELRFTDRGLLERSIGQGALRVGMTDEEFVAQALTDLAAQRQEMASSPAAVQAIDAMAAFLTNSGSITVALSPSAPVPFSQMLVATQINPVLLVEMLNLEITAED